MTLYVPSYLGYQTYSYQQLIQPNSNLVIKVKFVVTYNDTELKALEEELIESYIAENELEGFEKTTEGIYVKILSEGEEGSKVSGNNDVVRFTFRLFQLDNSNPVAESESNSPLQTTVGNEGNLKFLNLGLKGVKKDMELEMLIPSDLGFTNSIQVFPYVIRKDLFEKGFINQIVGQKNHFDLRQKLLK